VCRARAERGVEVEEVDRDDAVSLAGEELPPGWAATARGWMDTGRGEDVPHGGGTNPVPQPGQLALDPPMSPSGFSSARRRTNLLIADRVDGRPRRRRAA
jgi:hypothetical protein